MSLDLGMGSGVDAVVEAWPDAARVRGYARCLSVRGDSTNCAAGSVCCAAWRLQSE